MLPSFENIKIAVVGLGYVGLPLVVAFGKSRFAPVIGIDSNASRVAALHNFEDVNTDVSEEELKQAKITYSTNQELLGDVNVIIVAVPTPINQANQPDLSPVVGASEMIGKYIKKGTVVIYESTVYPGVTEEICVPIVERISGLSCSTDWFVGYSPERVNPGDTKHSLETIIKVVSGMDEETKIFVAKLYREICKGGVHLTPNIKTAEAAKVIENVQRDLNIALVNELALIFARIGIQTHDVLEAAGTKWNFHKYQPGLVGGHCIGVDPYYLTYRAQELGYHPEVILAGRRINDSMPEHVAQLMIRGLVEAGKVVQGSQVLVMGLTFKEDIRDIRNSKIHDTIKIVQSYGVQVFGHDPNLFPAEVEHFGVEYVSDLATAQNMDGIIFSAMHKQFRSIKLSQLQGFCQSHSRAVIVDIKSWFLSEWKKGGHRSLIYKCL